MPVYDPEYEKIADCYKEEISNKLNKRDRRLCPPDDSQCVKSLKYKNDTHLHTGGAKDIIM